MSATRRGTWLQLVQARWAKAQARCELSGCGRGRRLWPRLARNGRVRLHDSSYCVPTCFENAARQYFSEACGSRGATAPVAHRIPLGLWMLSRGQITGEQLRTALDAQRADRRLRIGEWLGKLGFVTEQQVTIALGLQWACPVLDWKTPLDLSCATLLPYGLLERFRLLPVRYVSATRTFYLAFCDGIDYAALYAIERMLDCRTQACLVSRSILERGLEQLGHQTRTAEVLFASRRDPAAMAHITSSYVLQLGAEQVRIVGCGEYIWVRLDASRRKLTLLFRHSSSSLLDEEPPRQLDDSWARQVTA